MADSASDDLPFSPAAERQASIFSRLTFSWFSPLLRRGASRPIQLTDIPPLPFEDTPQAHADIFHALYRHVSDPTTTPDPILTSTQLRLARLFRILSPILPRLSRVTRAIHVTTARPYLIAAAWKPIWLAVSISQAFCIRAILTYLTRTDASDALPSRWVLVPLAFAIGLGGIAMSISQHTVFFHSHKAAIHAQGALASNVYRKLLRLPPAAFNAFSAQGSLGSYLVTDIHRINEAYNYFHFCWFGFIEIAVIAALLIIDLGISALFSLAFMILLIPLQIFFASKIAKARKKVTSISDRRIHHMHNLLSAIQLVKYSAWERHFQELVQGVRAEEMIPLRTSATIRSINISIFFVAPLIVSLITFIPYVFLFKNHLEPSVAFSTVAFFSILSRILVLLPIGWLASAEASVSARRLDKFFQLPELPSTILQKHMDDRTPVCSLLVEHSNPSRLDSTQDVYVSINQATFSTDVQGQPGFSLRGVNLSAAPGHLVCVVGHVGSGKSTLLSGLLGDAPLIDGTAKVHGRYAFCAQKSWIVNGTLRHNITMFGSQERPDPLDFQWYQTVVKACALTTDIEALPAGDLTEIGERGVNLSGGQKARVALARAVYAQCDVYLLDDPLSAVDASVSSHLITHVLSSSGLLSRRICIIATHQISVLPLASTIIVLENGTVTHSGTYDELRAIGVNFGAFELDSDNDVGPQKDESPRSSVTPRNEKVQSNQTSSPRQQIASTAEKAPCPVEQSSSRNEAGSSESTSLDPNEEKVIQEKQKKDGKLVTEEDRQVGQVTFSVLRSYIDAAGGWGLSLLVLLTFIAAQSLRQSADVWFGLWSSDVSAELDVNSAAFRVENWRFTRISLILVVLTMVVTMIRATFFAYVSMRAAKKLHDKLLSRVLHGTMAFFDTNPTGRILNRFSKDIDQIDMQLLVVLQDVLQIHFLALGAIITIATILPWFLIPVVPLCGAFYYLQLFYKKSSRELKRLDGITSSPIYSSLVETLAGSTTIRAFGFHQEFATSFDGLVSTRLSTFHKFSTAGRWLGIRLDAVSSTIVFFSAFLVIAMGDRLKPGLAGVAMTTSIVMTGLFQWGVRQAAEAENLFTSVERVVDMASRTPIEAAYDVPENVPAKAWPSEGVVEFDNVVLRYRPELEPALRGITFCTRPHERIGIVGRTGSGKSSLFVSLFRIVELSEGIISIDGVDIATMGLYNLRSRMAIVPQDAVLFNGTIRSNLDPTSQWSDAILWDALGKVCMRDAVKEMGSQNGESDEPGGLGLDAVVHGNGSNLSVGERQLLCLARVILSGVQVVLFDEASASLDNATDTVVQRTIRSQLANRTVLTIAHRLATVADCDRILVIDSGKVVEFDTPEELLGRGGYYAQLVHQASEVCDPVS